MWICEKGGNCVDPCDERCGHYIEVEPVVHGKWEAVLEGVWNLPMPVCVGWRCSECGREEQHKEPYCNCGARMDGDSDEG